MCSSDLLKIQLKNKILTIGSVYGPNDDDIDFYRQLDSAVELLSCDQIVIGGDWNATFSNAPNSEQNIDCLNMARPPNSVHSRAITELCNNLGLMDPFRFLNPNRREFTYMPRNRLAQNRSRIDFFLISDQFGAAVSECNINPATQSKLFDHKAINLFLNKKKVRTIKIGRAHV